MLQTTLTLINLHWQGKSQPYELSKSKKKKKKIEKTFRALKMIAWSFSAHPNEKRLIAYYILPVKLN